MANRTPLTLNTSEKRIEQVQSSDTVYIPNDLTVYSTLNCADGYTISDSGDIYAYTKRIASFADNTHYDRHTTSLLCADFYNRKLFSITDQSNSNLNWNDAILQTTTINDGNGLNCGEFFKTNFLTGDQGGRGFFPVVANSSGVTGISVVDPNSHNGCMAYLYLSTGTSAVGAAHARGNDSIYLNNAFAEYEWRARVQVSDLSTSQEEYHIQVGIQSPTSATTGLSGHNHIIFHNDRATYGDTNWRAITRLADNNATVTDTGVAASTSWQRLFWKLDRNNNAARVRFYINDSLVATHTTNIPESTTNLHFRMACIKTAGTSARSLRIDYVTFQINFLNRQTRY